MSTYDIALEKRTWHYVHKPAVYEIAACSCGNQDTMWSEFAKHIWCPVCKKDFIPEHSGILDSPVGSHLTRCVGISFDRINIASQKRERFNIETGEYIAE